MLNEQDAREVMGSTAYSTDDDKLGKVGQVFLDDETGRPEFVTIQTGLFGTKESFLPVAEATFSGDRLTVPFTKDKVKDAPNVDADGGHLDRDEEQRLYQYYGMQYSTSQADSGLGYGGGDRNRDFDSTTDTDRDTLGNDTDRDTIGHDTSGPTTDDAMTRSEEQVRVGTTSEETGRARLRKYVTTEEETHTVPVRKERAVLETEPITDANAGNATDGPAISDEEHEVVLHEERPVVEKTTEPVERVRVGTETTTEDQTVTEEVRKEKVEADGDVDDRR